MRRPLSQNSQRSENHSTPQTTKKGFQFFKIIHPSINEHLKLPLKFVQKFGQELSKEAVLEVNDGKIWSLDLRKTSDEIAFNNNWLEFVEYYSISVGYLLVFNYIGNSRFRVAIFDTSNLEITYPKEFNYRDQPSVDEEESEEEMLNDTTQVELPKKLKFKHPHFKVVMYSTYVQRGYLKLPSEYTRKYIKDDLKSLTLKVSENGKWEVGCLKYNAAHVHLSKGWMAFVRGNILKEGDECVFEMNKKNASYTVHIFRNEETGPNDSNAKNRPKASDIKEKSGDLKLENPNFELVMKPTHVNGYGAPLSGEIAREHLKNGANNATLKVADGRTYQVVCTKYPTYARFGSGWHAFMIDNNLKAGDKCVFELVDSNKKEIVLRVHILARKEETEELHHQEQPSGDEERDEEMLNDTCQVEQPNELKHKHPFFKVRMTPTYAQGVYSIVPLKFARLYLKDNLKSVLLKVSDNGICQEWEVFYVKYNTGDTRLSNGWGTFARENNLKQGDECVFEMIKQNASFKVHIFRSGELVPEIWNIQE